ncbi:hypothetical protein RvY_19362, partial [Ramazzottius varieornatus]
YNLQLSHRKRDRTTPVKNDKKPLSAPHPSSHFYAELHK